MANSVTKKEIEKNREHSRARKREILKGVRTWYILLLFVALYLVVLLVYSVSLKTFLKSDILAFLTSPFNFIEDFSKGYNSPMEGYLLNAVFTAGIILVSILYSELLALSKRIKPELVFWTSILASYLLSSFVWLFTGAPATGTSIIGFCMTAYLFLSSLHDIPTYFSKLKSNQSFFAIFRVFTVDFLFVVSFLAAVLFYWLGNTSYPLHFIGGAICAVLIITAIAKRRPT